MGSLRLIKAEVLLICFFAVSQQIMSFNYCPPDYNCQNNGWNRPSQGFSEMSWIIPLLGLLGAGFGLFFFIAIVFFCCKIFKHEDVASIPEERRERVHVPPPTFNPPSSPSLNHFMEPPPYSEVVWKVPIYPPPLDQPPAYDNLAMDDLPRLDGLQPTFSSQR